MTTLKTNSAFKNKFYQIFNSFPLQLTISILQITIIILKTTAFTKLTLRMHHVMDNKRKRLKAQEIMTEAPNIMLKESGDKC